MFFKYIFKYFRDLIRLGFKTDGNFYKVEKKIVKNNNNNYLLNGAIYVFNFDQFHSFLTKIGKNNFSNFIHLNIPNISEDNQMYTSV